MVDTPGMADRVSSRIRAANLGRHLPGGLRHRLRQGHDRLRRQLGFEGFLQVLTLTPELAEGTVASERLNAMASVNQARRYLEVGVATGTTFEAVRIESKQAVEPYPLFSSASMPSGTRLAGPPPTSSSRPSAQRSSTTRSSSMASIPSSRRIATSSTRFAILRRADSSSLTTRSPQTRPRRFLTRNRRRLLPASWGLPSPGRGWVTSTRSFSCSRGSIRFSTCGPSTRRGGIKRCCGDRPTVVATRCHRQHRLIKSLPGHTNTCSATGSRPAFASGLRMRSSAPSPPR